MTQRPRPSRAAKKSLCSLYLLYFSRDRIKLKSTRRSAFVSRLRRRLKGFGDSCGNPSSDTRRFTDERFADKKKESADGTHTPSADSWLLVLRRSDACQQTADVSNAADLLHLFLRHRGRILNSGKPQTELVWIRRATKSFFKRDKAR
jgi:hypothetical protein